MQVHEHAVVEQEPVQLTLSQSGRPSPTWPESRPGTVDILGLHARLKSSSHHTGLKFREEYTVFIPGAYEGYITLETFEGNRSPARTEGEEPALPHFFGPKPRRAKPGGVDHQQSFSSPAVSRRGRRLLSYDVPDFGLYLRPGRPSQDLRTPTAYRTVTARCWRSRRPLEGEWKRASSECPQRAP